MEKEQAEKNHEGFWAAIYVESGLVRDVVYAEGQENAERLLLSNYTPDLRALVEVKPVEVKPLFLAGEPES